MAHSNWWDCGCNIDESAGIIMWPTQIGRIMGAILVNHVGHYIAHSNWWDFRCNIGESGGVFQWPTTMHAILGAILVNHVGYVSVVLPPS